MPTNQIQLVILAVKDVEKALVWFIQTQWWPLHLQHSVFRIPPYSFRHFNKELKREHKKTDINKNKKKTETKWKQLFHFRTTTNWISCRAYFCVDKKKRFLNNNEQGIKYLEQNTFDAGWLPLTLCPRFIFYSLWFEWILCVRCIQFSTIYIHNGIDTKQRKKTKKVVGKEWKLGICEFELMPLTWAIRMYTFILKHYSLDAHLNFIWAELDKSPTFYLFFSLALLLPQSLSPCLIVYHFHS